MATFPHSFVLRRRRAVCRVPGGTVNYPANKTIAYQSWTSKQLVRDFYKRNDGHIITLSHSVQHLLVLLYNRLQLLQLESLESRVKADLILCYKIIHGHTDTDKNVLFNFAATSSTGGHDLTRSQAVARIADRTAKNCRGHVT